MRVSNLRRAAEHEAAHALVAMHYGLRVRSIQATASGVGHTRCEGEHTAEQDAVITAAGDLWEREFAAYPYVDAACSDLAALERSVGAAGVWQARRTARQVLHRYRREVLALASRLEHDRHLVMVDNRLAPASRRPPRVKGVGPGRESPQGEGPPGPSPFSPHVSRRTLYQAQTQ